MRLCRSSLFESRSDDVLGVTNGFWRNSKIEDVGAVRSAVEEDARRVAGATSVCVIGGGAAGCSAAFNIKTKFPEKQVHILNLKAALRPGFIIDPLCKLIRLIFSTAAVSRCQRTIRRFAAPSFVD